MWTVPSRIVGALAIPLLTVLMAGCGGMSEDEARNDVHERVDKLAERLGTSSRVRGEGAAGMDPKASTLGYSYRVRVDVDPKEALGELRGPIADEMRADGWTVDDDEDLTLVTYGHDDGRAAGIAVNIDDNYVNIIGETPFNTPESLRPFVGLRPFFYDFRATTPQKLP